jgi:hypothetical protein
VNFTVTNGGGAATGALTVLPPGSGFAVAGNACSAALQPGSKCVFAIHFAPTVAGNVTATVTVTDLTVSGSATLHGTATPAASLTITPMATCAAPADDLLAVKQHALHADLCANPFKATVIGQTNGSYPVESPVEGTDAGTGGAGVTFEVQNLDTSGIDTGAITIKTTGAAAGDFVISSNNCPVTLNPGNSCMVTVDFTPTAAGLRAATLQVTTVKGGNVSASLNGLGLPFIEILPCSLGNGVIAGGPDPNTDGSLYGTCTPLDSTGGTNFGQVPLNVLNPRQIINQEKAFVVRVRGSNATDHKNKLTVGLTTPTSAADFTVSTTNATPCTDVTMDVSTGMRQCVVVLDFFPQSGVGDKTGTLTITGSSGGSASVNLSGTATGPLYFNPAPVDFGSVNVGTVSAMTLTTGISISNGDHDLQLAPVLVTVYNYGAAAQGPLSFALTGANATEFALVDDNCSDITLGAGGESCDLTYIMMPTSVGAKTATLTVTTGALTSSVQFQGNGVNPSGAASPIGLDPNTHVFVSQAANTASAYQVFTVSLVGTTETGNINYKLQTVGGGSYCEGKTKCLGFELAQGGTEGTVGTCGVSDTKHLSASSTSCTIKVRFRPTTSSGASRAVNLVVWEANSNIPLTAALTGTVTPQLVLSAATHDFGTLPELGKSAKYVFTVTNAGTTLYSTGGPNLVSFTGDDSVNPNGAETTCGTSLGAGSTCLVTLSFDPAPGTVGNKIDYLVVGDASAKLTATVVKPAHISVIGVDADIYDTDGNDLYQRPYVYWQNDPGNEQVAPLGNLVVDFGTVVKNQPSNSVTIKYINDGGVATTALNYQWDDWSDSRNTLGPNTANPFFPFTSDSSSTACVNGSGVSLTSLDPNQTCTVTFHLLAGTGTVSNRPEFQSLLTLSADNAVVGNPDFLNDNAITAQGWYAPSTGGTYITPSFFNFSATGATAIGASSTAHVFTLTVGTSFNADSKLKGRINPQYLTDAYPVDDGIAFEEYRDYPQVFPNNGDFVVGVTGVGAKPCYGTSTSNTLDTGMVSGDTCTFSVTFTPLAGADQYRMGQIAITNGASADDYGYGETVYAVAGVMGIAPKPATLAFSLATGGGGKDNDFGDVVYNVRSEKKTMTITNTGELASGTLTLSAGAYYNYGPDSGSPDSDPNAVTDAGRFAVGTECNKVINPGASCTFTITVLPGATVYLPRGKGYDIKVGATSTTPTADTITPSDKLLARGVEPAQLSLTPSSLQDFGNRAMGTVSATTLTVTIQNGNAGASAYTQDTGPLTIKIDDPNNFNLVTSDCPTDPNGPGLQDAISCTVTIQFTPITGVALASHTATLSVSGTAVTTTTAVTMQVKGTATTALAFVKTGTGTPDDPAQFMTLETTPKDFGSLPVGTTPIFDTDGQVLELWVENAKGAPDTGLLSTSLTGSDFRIILNNCVGVKLGYDNNPNGGSEFCNLWVRFEPTSAGAKTGSLTVSGTPGNSATLALKGTGS